MSNYHERLVLEKAELDDKLSKLESFLPTEGFHKLPLVSRDLLHRQAVVMKEYSDTLQTRIYIK